MNQIDLAGRTAVVTGAASGIGLGVAHRLAVSGARVLAWDLDAGGAQAVAAGLPAVPQGSHAGFGVDVTDEAAVAQATADSLARAGAIDILVCSAGITGPNAPVVDYDPAAWRRVFEVNVHGVFLCNRAVVRTMLAAGYGRVINIASVAGKDGNPNASAYSASKAAVRSRK